MDHTPSRFHPRCAVRLALALAVLLAAVPAVPGLAAPITATLHFEGPDGFGVAEAEALASGLPILSIPLVQATGLDVQRDLDLASFRYGPPTTVTSDWSVTNGVGRDLIGDLYLVFAKPLASELDLGNRTETVDYDPADVGLTLRNGAGGLDWVLLQAFDPGVGNVYYPAVSLDSLVDEATSELFGVRYVIDDPVAFLDSTGIYRPGLPAWQLLAAFTPVPEPSTALLVAGGLAGLALSRRRRS